MIDLEHRLQRAGGFIAKNIYRPMPSPNITIPYGLRSVGHCRARVGWGDAPYEKTFVQVFWVVSGVGQFIVKDAKWLVHAGECFVYYPGHTHLITAISDYFEYRFFTIDGLLAQPTVQSFGLLDEPMFVGDCPISDFEILGKEILDITPFGQANCSAKAFNLLAKVAGFKKVKNYSSVINACIALIEERLHCSDIGIQSFAKELKIHRSQLTRQFKKELGMSPIEFLIAKRVQKGLKLLEENKYSIKEISGMCGYQQPDYFAKAIRKFTGLNPKDLRG